MSSNSGPQRLDAPVAGRYRLDPHRSSVAFKTRHLFGLGSVPGTMRVASGDITLDPAVPEASLDIVIDVASFDTGQAKRDDRVRSARLLHADEYRELRFRGSNLEQSGGRWTLDGELTVRGVTRPVTLTLDSIESTATGFLAHATTRIDRYAFGVTAIKGIAARWLNVNLTAVAERT